MCDLVGSPGHWLSVLSYPGNVNSGIAFDLLRLVGVYSYQFLTYYNTPYPYEQIGFRNAAGQRQSS